MTDAMTDSLQVRAQWYALGQIEGESGRTGDPDGRAPAFARWVNVRGLLGITMHDRWQEFIHGGLHWHVRRHSDDDDIYVTYDVTSALDYAATELDHIADGEYDGGISAGENGDYEGAWHSARRVAKWRGMVDSLRNIVKQATVPEHERAPLYRGSDSGTRLAVATEHTIRKVWEDGPDSFAVWRCWEHECRPLPDGEGDND